MSEPHSTTIPDVHGGSTEVSGPHGSTADHGDEGHGHDDHGHDAMALGPIDWTMWVVGAAGVAVALVTAALFWVAVYS